MEPSVFIHLGGDAARIRLSDARVSRLAKGMLTYFSPLSPDDMILATRESRIPLVTCPSPLQVAWSDEWDAGTEACLFRADIGDFPPCVVNFFYKRGEERGEEDSDHVFTIGHPEKAFYVTEAEREFLACMEASQGFVSGRKVLRELASMLCEKRCKWETSLPRVYPFDDEILSTIHEAESSLIHTGTLSWKTLVDRVGEGEIVPCFYTNVAAWISGNIVVVTVVHHHWKVETRTRIAHSKTPSFRLDLVAYSLCCNSVVLTREDTSPRPTWISRISVEADPLVSRLLSGDCVVEGSLPSLPPLSNPPLPPVPPLPPLPLPPTSLPESREGLCKRARITLDVWRKSSATKDLDSPTLTRLIHPMTSFRSGDLLSLRKTSYDDCSEARSILANEFGEKYSDDVVSSSLPDSMCGLYEVFRGEEVVSCFVAYTFEASFSDGRVGSAFMIDSFAVPKRLQGQGIGGKVFHGLCRGIAREAAGEIGRHAVFAQCLTSKKTKDFWYDKLDDSSMARSLLHQAYIMYPERVNIHPCCCARGRIYST